MQKYKRWAKSLIESALKYRRIVLLAGSRQCGKTTLAREFNVDHATYQTLDDPSILAAAQSDLTGFVMHNKPLMIIDEIQRAPQLLPVIKKVVDEDTRPGQFFLTGSANIPSLPTVTESLAGRVRKIRLRTLSEGEIQDKQPLFFDRVLKSSFGHEKSNYNRNDILELAFRGGYSEVLFLDSRQRTIWHNDYIEAIFERDLNDIINIRRQDAMRDLFATLSAWSSKLMDVSAIGSGLSIQRPTLESYINALQVLFVIERLSPWTKTDYGRVNKHGKIFINDSGLMASTLKWHIDDVRYDSDRAGKLIETFIFNELSIQIDISEGQYGLYHYRDREKREIDFIVESNNALLGIEVKTASLVQSEDFKHLIWFKNNIAKERKFIGIILYTGEYPLSFKNNMWAIPISCLWS